MAEQADYTHDVFISYSHADREWVEHTLLPQLESAGLKVVIDYRDFELGVASLVNMERAVDSSRHTLVVLTPAWIESEWTQFESLLVGTADPAGRRRKLIPLLLKPCKLPTHIEILTRADFTQPSEREKEMDKLVKSISAKPGGSEQINISPPQKGTEEAKGQSILVQTGLIALTELMQAPEVRSAVVTFRNYFQSTCKQIEVLGDYKDLHDLLHTLQLQCHNFMLQQARRPLDDEVEWDDLIDPELTLQEVINDLREVAQRPSCVAIDTAWIQDLVVAREELHGAIESSHTKQLKKAVWCVNRVLAVQPSQINNGLNQAAYDLHLSELVQAMTCVRDYLVPHQLDPKKVHQFEEGVNALASLDDKLAACVKAHDLWQAVDAELRRIEGNLGEDITELELSWPGLKAIADLLYSGSSEEWALLFKTDSEKLESAIAAQNPAKVKQYFRRYRRQADMQFYRVDGDLKKQCEDLRAVGEPLSSVLRMIE
jgi:hypothetical protein